MKYKKIQLTENFIINKFLKKLNFNKFNTFNFENDASYIESIKKQKIVITSDSISENLDFFKYDNPKSIAKKITTINLSDLSAMGVNPHAYSLNLYLPYYVDFNWLKIFTDELLKIQKKYNFYLLGGDLSKSNKLHISSTFFGYSSKNKVVPQNLFKKNSDIWVTGNVGDSYVGLQLLKRKILIKDKNLNNYFLNKYYYPKPCLLGHRISSYVESMKDISDGFIGDLNKMIKNKSGAKININQIPLSKQIKFLIKKNIIKIDSILNAGDVYQLIIISNKKYRSKIIDIAKKNNTKISKVGKIVKNLEVVDDSNNIINIPRDFDHFL